MLINAIVVIYNSALMESQTIKAIFNSNQKDITLNIIIWNNGPNLLKNEDIDDYISECKTRKISTIIYQDTRNISLSKIYNLIIEKEPFDFFAILDQDTKISTDFFSNILENKEYELICPAIYLENNNNQLDSPVYSNSLEIIPSGDFNANNMLTCGSGIAISHSLCEKVINKYGFMFDEAYAFYLADHSFLFNLNDFNFIKGKCVGKIHHNLSGYGVNYKKMKETAKLEHGLALILRRVHKQKKTNIVKNLFHALKFSIKSRCSYKSTLKIVSCVLTGNHPRSKYSIEKNKEPTVIFKL
ncbi:glycosyl transferase [Pectobacterium actinidiae]|uniref:glycosyltransferase family 2 protein n=1 Tax=Pectobacterium actinidiae TaxID=1507808 RepID=UPI002A81F2FD|nr:glycosyl transferase [Pectobacterium actinidiae]MDY4316173.1 glycosyl transferase [Pectobacterium actinidiae]